MSLSSDFLFYFSSHFLYYCISLFFCCSIFVIFFSEKDDFLYFLLLVGTLTKCEILITACAVATSSYISDVPSQWEGRNFDPPQLPHFSTDLNETQHQERYPRYDPTCKICLMWDDGKGVCVGCLLYTSDAADE